jgi:hypothetical protein
MRIARDSFYSEWSQDGGYGWKNYSSGWQPDSGYSDDALDNHLPVRTISNSEYYSAKMKLDLHTDDFSRECARGLDAFYVNHFFFLCISETD